MKHTLSNNIRRIQISTQIGCDAVVKRGVAVVFIVFLDQLMVLCLNRSAAKVFVVSSGYWLNILRLFALNAISLVIFG